MASLVILESDAEELAEIESRLQKDGFKSGLSLEHQLRYIWRQLARAESSLASSLDSVEELRKQHVQEMIEVESYVDNIRQLSNEREALTVELESENEKLKSDLEVIREKQNTCFTVHELAMLLRDSTVPEHTFEDKNSIRDHLGTLLQNNLHLSERMRHLETEITELRTSKGDENAIKLLEQERSDMELEIQKMQETMRMVKQEENRMHEKEMNEVKAEKQELQKKLNMSEKKCKELQGELLKVKNKMEDEQRVHQKEMAEMTRKQNGVSSLNQGATGDYTRRLGKAVEEMKVVGKKQNEVEKQKNELQNAISLLENVVKKEKDAVQTAPKSGEDGVFKDLRKELDNSKQRCMELQIKLGKMETEKKHADNQLNETQKDLDHLKRLTAEKDKNLSEEQLSFLRYQSQIKELTDTCNSTSEQLEAANTTINEQKGRIGEMTLLIAKTENDLREKQNEAETTEKDLKNQINELRRELTLKTSEVVELQTNLAKTKEDCDEVILKVKREAEMLQEKYNEESDKTRSTSSEVTSLRAQIMELKQDLNASLTATVSREKETSGHLQTLEKTRDDLVAELNRCLGQGKTQKDEMEAMNNKICSLEQEKSSLHSIVLSQERKVAEVQEKLQITERKLAEQEGVLTYERSRSEDTNHKFELTVNNLNNLRQECDTLREELRILSEKLLTQHDAALESQSKYDSLITQLRNEMQHERETYVVERHKLGSQLEQATKECKEYTSLFRQREEELGRLQSDYNLVTRTGAKTTTALEFESRLRETLEHKNSTLEDELAKAWDQTKTLMERMATLEADKGQLERDLERKSQLYQMSEDGLQKKDADVVGLTIARDTAGQRAEAAEVKVLSLEREKENIHGELERLQRELSEAYGVKAELEIRKEESHTLKSQLTEEEQNRSLHQQTIDELKRQIDMLHTRDRASLTTIEELQTTVKEYENRIEILQNDLKRATQDLKSVGQENLNVSDKFAELKHENEQLQVDLVVASERIEYLEGKCERRKAKAILKIQALKDRYERDKRSAEASVLSLQNSLELSKRKLRKEEEWKNTTDTARKLLIEEKQDLLTRLTQGEEVIREHLRNLREAESCLSRMEKDNLEMRDKLNILSRQNEHLERCNRILERNENRTHSPVNGPMNQSLYDALNRIRMNESLSSTDYSPHVSLTQPSPQLNATQQTKSLPSLTNGSYINKSPSETLLVN